MNAVIRFEDFILCPHFSKHLAERVEERGLKASQEDIIGIMVKIKDNDVGKVDEEIKKGVTNRDATIISKGGSIAGSILGEVGVDPSTFVSTPLKGAHPGGTARIGIAVDKNLELIREMMSEMLQRDKKPNKKSKSIYIPFTLFKTYKKKIVKWEDFSDKNGRNRVLREGNNGLANFSGDSSCGDFMANSHKP